MLDEAAIQETARRPANAARQPARIILLGSCARGNGSGPIPPYAGTRLRPLTPCAVDFRYDDEAIHLLAESEMRASIWETLNFTGGELASDREEKS
jgi:hypothetical protein